MVSSSDRVAGKRVGYRGAEGKRNMVVVFDCDCAAIPESEVPVFASRYAALMSLSFQKLMIFLSNLIQDVTQLMYDVIYIPT